MRYTHSDIDPYHLRQHLEKVWPDAEINTGPYWDNTEANMVAVCKFTLNQLLDNKERFLMDLLDKL